MKTPLPWVSSPPTPHPQVYVDGTAHARSLRNRQVGIPAGTILLRHTAPPSMNKAGQPLKRAQEVIVHDAHFDLMTQRIEITWPGQAGYWKSVSLDREKIVLVES
jgi:hypothetical protein